MSAKRWWLVIVVGLSLSSSLVARQPIVHVVTVDAAITPATADFIRTEIHNAAAAKAECLILRLDTPGGLLASTRTIVSEILEAPVPVVVYVSPAGAQAASAGTFITLAGHVAAMAPGTNIGAAHPVTLNQGADSVMMEKATNDAAAFIRTISEKRKRNVRWAEEAVRKSVSITEAEALRDSVIDCIAANVEDLLEEIDGRKVEISAGIRTINVRNAEIVNVSSSFQQDFLNFITDPNVAYILMMLGFYGLLFELYSPGAIVPGVIGGICIVLGFYALNTLPVNYAGLALILFAFILFLLEIKVISHGLLTIGGVISLAVGSVMLFEQNSLLEVVSLSWQVIVLVVGLTVAFFAFAIGMGIRAQRQKSVTGSQGLVGEFGETLTPLSPAGQVRVHGEIWSATSLDGALPSNTRVFVDRVEGLKLYVRKKLS